MLGKVNQSENVADFLAVPGSEPLDASGSYVPMVYKAGPLLAGPELVSLYWGAFSQSQIDAMQAWRRGVAGWLCGVGAPPGQDQVIKQYGTCGATVGPWHQEASAPATATEPDVKDLIASLQDSGALPGFAPERLFLVFTTDVGFSELNATDAHGWCAYHGQWGVGSYFAICPYPTGICAGSDATATWEGITCHEILEACTDPIPGTAWVEGTEEGGDTCNRDFTTLGFGTVQRFADNQQRACSIWTVQQEPDICAVAGSPNRLDIFVRGGDGAVWHRWWDGSAWRGFDHLGGIILDAPAAVSWSAEGLYHLLARGSDGGLWHYRRDGSAWGWENLGGAIIGTPSVVSWGANRIDVFAQGTETGAVWHQWSDGTTWGTWENLGGSVVGAPCVASWGPGRLDLFARGSADGALWHQAWDGSAWSGWASLGGVITSRCSAVSSGPDRLDAFAQGTDGALWHLGWDGSAWSPWQSLGGIIVGPPAAVSFGPDRLDVFAKGTDRALHHIWWDGSTWSGWENLGGVIVGSPVPVSWGPRRIDVFAEGSDRALWHRAWGGSTWAGWTTLGGVID